MIWLWFLYGLLCVGLFLTAWSSDTIMFLLVLVAYSVVAIVLDLWYSQRLDGEFTEEQRRKHEIDEVS